MSMKIPDERAVTASSLKSAYLAVFSLLGSPGGYSYIQGDALTPIRQRIMEPLKDGTIGGYVIKAPDDVSLKDIMLVSEPSSCWILKIAGHLVVLPLSGDSRISQPLLELQRLSGGQPIALEGLVSWSFSTFGGVRHCSGSFGWCRQCQVAGWPSYSRHTTERPPTGRDLHTSLRRVRYLVVFCLGDQSRSDGPGLANSRRAGDIGEARHAISESSRHSSQAPRRIRHKLKVDERRLNRRVPQPARQVVDGNSVHQQMLCVAVF